MNYNWLFCEASHRHGRVCLPPFTNQEYHVLEGDEIDKYVVCHDPCAMRSAEICLPIKLTKGKDARPPDF